MVNQREIEHAKQADSPQGVRWLSLALSCVFAFLLAVLWTWAKETVGGRWYDVINRLLDGSVRMIDDQPLWGAVLQHTLYFSPGVGLLICVYFWGVKRGRWLVPLAFFLGIVAYENYAWSQFVSAMRNFD